MAMAALTLKADILKAQTKFQKASSFHSLQVSLASPTLGRQQIHFNG
jgi:hypothetical protein